MLMVTKEQEKTMAIRVILLLIFLLVVFKLSLLSFVFNSTWCEEGVRGLAAKHIMEGSKTQSVFDYFVPYQGGSVIVTLLTVPIFKILGISVFTMRLVPLLLSVCMLVLLYNMLYRFYNWRTAFLGGAIYVLAPVHYTHYSLYCIGNHHSVLLFNLASIYLYCIIARGRDKLLYYLALGALSGFSVYFCYSSVFFLLAILILWWIKDKMFFLQNKFFIFVGGLIIGISPFIYYILTHLQKMKSDSWYNPLVYLNLSNIFASKGIIVHLKWIAHVFTVELSRSFNFDYFGKFPGRVIYDRIYYLVLCVVLIYFIMRFAGWVLSNLRARAKETDVKEHDPLPLLLGVYILVFFFGTSYSAWSSPGVLEHRYFFPLYLIFFIGFPLLIHNLSVKKRMPKLIIFLLPACILYVGLMGNLSLLSVKDVYSGRFSDTISFLKNQGIKRIYTYYLYKWVFAFETKEEIIASAAKIYTYFDASRTEVYDDNQFGERYFAYEKIVNDSVSNGEKYAYVFNKDETFPHTRIIEDYLKHNNISYEKKLIDTEGLCVYYNLSSKVKPADIDFKAGYKEITNK